MALACLVTRVLAGCVPPQAPLEYSPAGVVPPDLVLVATPRTLPEGHHVCDGLDGFARITSRPCGDLGLAAHEGPMPPGVVMVGATVAVADLGERLCMVRGHRVAIPAGHACADYGPGATRAELQPAPEPTGAAPSPGGGPVYVHGYTRRDGTYVRGYTRRR